MSPRQAPSVRRAYPQIARRVGLDRGSLAREYLSRNLPVVIPAESSGWHARWSPAALSERYGRCEIEAEEAAVVYVGERALIKRPLGATVEAILAGDPTLRWKGLEFLRKVPGMRDDLAANPPPYHALLPPSAGDFRDTLWIAPRGTMSSLHHDGNFDNLNLQISGRKLFLLVPPPMHQALHVYGSAESPLNPFVPDLKRFPRFVGANPVEAMLSPGDTLLIPKYWWHCVYAFEPSVNLSTHFSWRDELPPWRVLRGAPLLHRSLTVVAAAMKRRGLRRLADASRRLWCEAHARVVPRVEPQERGELL